MFLESRKKFLQEEVGLNRCFGARLMLLYSRILNNKKSTMSFRSFS